MGVGPKGPHILPLRNRVTTALPHRDFLPVLRRSSELDAGKLQVQLQRGRELERVPSFPANMAE